MIALTIAQIAHAIAGETHLADGDTPDTLAARVLAEEHKLYPYAVRLFVEDRLSIEQGDVRISDSHFADTITS